MIRYIAFDGAEGANRRGVAGSDESTPDAASRVERGSLMANAPFLFCQPDCVAAQGESEDEGQLANGAAGDHAPAAESASRGPRQMCVRYDARMPKRTSIEVDDDPRERAARQRHHLERPSRHFDVDVLTSEEIWR